MKRKKQIDSTFSKGIFMFSRTLLAKRRLKNTEKLGGQLHQDPLK
jgi:hypothetical protein